MRALAGRLVVAAALALSARAAAGEVTWVRAGEPARSLCGTAPAGWQKPELDDQGWTVREQPPDGGWPPGDGGLGCAGTLFLRWHFEAVGEPSGARRDASAEAVPRRTPGPVDPARLSLLTLRIRYTHGYAAYLNGVEIARRRLEPNAPPSALANDWHGPEFERVFVPLAPGLLRATGNVLAVEVHPRTLGREPTVDLELAGSDAARIVRGPYLNRLSEHEVTVLFDTDLPTVGEVRWGPDTDYGHTASDATPQKHHALKLTDLEAGAQVHYRVTATQPGLPSADALDAGDALFHTPPPAGKPLRFLIYGDVRSGHDVHALLNQSLVAEDADLAIITGDLVDRGSDEGDWERFFEIAGPLLRQLAIFPSPGNHEYARLGQGAPVYHALFPAPVRPGEEDTGYYSFDVAGVHFVALDSNQYRSPRQVAWLEHDLAEAEKAGARATFVYAHEPPYSAGLHGDNQVMIHDYVPILERHHVTMFFGGHDHDYERGHVGALDYIVTGGGGAELRVPRCGVVGKRPCGRGVLAFANEHHYVVAEVLPTFVRLCPKRVDATPLEACVQLPLPDRAREKRALGRSR